MFSGAGGTLFVLCVVAAGLCAAALVMLAQLIRQLRNVGSASAAVRTAARELGAAAGATAEIVHNAAGVMAMAELWKERHGDGS
jgi:hypothetical protein